MKKIIALLLALSMALALTACGGDGGPAADEAGTSAAPVESSAAGAPAGDSADSDLAYVKGNGKLVIGYTVYAPMNYTDENGEFTGFDTELARLVCEKLGVEPEFSIINWSAKETLLAGMDIDCIWNGMTLDADREATMACTVPYVKNAQVVLVKEGTDYTDTNSLAGKVVCAELGSAGEVQLVGKDNGDGTFTEPDPGLAQAEYVGKKFQSDCLLEVKAGTADAAVLDLTLARSMTGEGTDYADLKIVDYLGTENYGVAFRKGSDIRDEVNAIFAELVADGTMGQLADKYGLELAD